VAKAGWLCAAAAALAGGGAIAVPDHAGELAVAALVAGGSAVMVLGAPFARAGKPAGWRIALLFAVAVAATVLTVALDAVLAVAVVYLSYVLVTLAMARWPPSEWLQRDVRIRMSRPPAGGLVAVAGSVPAYFALIVAIARTTDPGATRFALVAALTLVMTGVWVRIATAYSGRRVIRRLR
jgi:hypothetical protein